MSTTTLHEGWGWPLRATRSHYFVDDRSLCGRWWYTGPLDPPTGPGADSDCGQCVKLLARRDR